MSQENQIKPELSDGSKVRPTMHKGCTTIDRPQRRWSERTTDCLPSNPLILLPIVPGSTTKAFNDSDSVGMNLPED
jgi:hypothetical protein